jgi:hypothetical protein
MLFVCLCIFTSFESNYLVPTHKDEHKKTHVMCLFMFMVFIL